MKNCILFDIDYTLLNSQLFKQNFRERIAKFLNVSAEDFATVEGGYVHRDTGFTDFNPEEYIDYISKNYDAKAQDISRNFFNDVNFKNISYPDVIPALENLVGDYKLGIFSEGFEAFQLIKLQKSGLIKYFEPELTFIYRRKLTKESLNLLPGGCFVVDDNYYVAEALSKVGLFKPVWLNRKTEEKHPDCETVFDLTNLRKLLDSYSKI